MRFVVSLTSVPRRFGTSLRSVLASITQQRNCPDIILSVPRTYRKWGAASAPAYLYEIPNLIVNHIDVDYGPATKLLGALTYLRESPGITHVLTVDDDVRFTDGRYLDYLMRCARVLPEAALTVGGIALRSPPYRCDDGLRYRNRYTFVDVPAGYQGVVYPVRPLIASPLTFSLRDELPGGIFNEDDAYFGILLSRLGVPLFALPGPWSNRLQFSAEAGESAVEEGVTVDRRTNEAAIFADATERGLLVPASRRPARPFGISRRVRLRYERARTALPF